MKCKYCGVEFDNKISLSNHSRYCKLNPLKRECNLSKLNRERNALCKGLTKETSERYAKISAAQKGRVGRKHTEEEKEILRQKARENGSGGYVRGSGRGKKGWYKGYWCDSSWELAYVIYHLDNNIPIQRCSERREYLFKGKKYKYNPDFIVEDKIVEIKGWETEQTRVKREMNPDVLFLFEKDLKYIFDYVHSKYGKDFIKLYEKEA